MFISYVYKYKQFSKITANFNGTTFYYHFEWTLRPNMYI